jgi:hypothetical protein
MVIRHRRHVAVATLCVACSAAGGSRHVTVRDSSGIRIVESTAAAWPEDKGWRLSAEPILDIGADPSAPGQELFRVVGAATLPDAGLVVAEAGSHQLKYFDAGGTLVTTAGRQGDGPGEFSGYGPTWARVSGNVVEVWDQPVFRLSAFDLSGNFVSSVRAQPPGSGPLYLLGALDNELIAQSMTFASPSANTTVRRDTVTLWVLDSIGMQADTIGTVPGNEIFTSEWNGRVGGGPLPFGARLSIALAQDAIIYAPTDRYELHRIDRTGALLDIVRLPRPIPPLTADDIDAFKRERMDNAPGNAQGRVAWRDWLDAVPYPEHQAVFGRLVVDEDGNVWASGQSAPTIQPRDWFVFSRDGPFLGEVSVPERFRLYSIAHGKVVGRWQDELDVEHVRVYRLLKP